MTYRTKPAPRSRTDMATIDRQPVGAGNHAQFAE